MTLPVDCSQTHRLHNGSSLLLRLLFATGPEATKEAVIRLPLQIDIQIPVVVDGSRW